jgi:hypothetical protein
MYAKTEDVVWNKEHLLLAANLAAINAVVRRAQHASKMETFSEAIKMQRGCPHQQGKCKMSNEVAPLLNKHSAGRRDEMFPNDASPGVIAQRERKQEMAASLGIRVSAPYRRPLE